MREPLRLLRNAATLLAGLGMLSLTAAAQEGKPPVKVPDNIIGNEHPAVEPPGGPPPRTADGHVDLSGVWIRGEAGVQTQYTGSRTQARRGAAEDIPFQPWAAAKIKGMTPTQLQLGMAGVNCMPLGDPGIFLFNPHPIQFFQLPGVLVQLQEVDNHWRLVHTDGRPHEKDSDPTFNGDAVGHWEGDTLVIDVVAIDERTWNNTAGWFHSDQEHLIERISRPFMNRLTYQVTIEDPKVLTKPWTSPVQTYSLAHEDLFENFCTRNDEVTEFEKLQSQESGAQK
jgi:hypothetical protein